MPFIIEEKWKRQRTRGNNVRILGDSNGWARSRRARYFRGFAHSDTSIGVAILGRTRARARILRFVPRSSEGAPATRSACRRGPSAAARSRTRRRGRPAGVRGIVEKKKENIGPARRRPLARGAGPPEGLLDARKDAARTRAATGGGHLALQSTAAAASSNSSQWSSVHDSSGCPNETHSFSRTRTQRSFPTHTHTRPRHTRSHLILRVAPCNSTRLPVGRESAWELDGPACASSSSERVPLSRSAPFDSLAAF